MGKHIFGGDEFHNSINKIYFGKYGFAVNKKSEDMALVEYSPIHENNEFNGAKRGFGTTTSKWIFSEDNGTKEGISKTKFNLLIDFYIEPNGAMGLHFHDEKEEFYYIIDGEITITTVNKNGDEYTEKLTVGDAHFVGLGQGHYGVAGSKGVRIITVCVDKN